MALLADAVQALGKMVRRGHPRATSEVTARLQHSSPVVRRIPPCSREAKRVDHNRAMIVLRAIHRVIFLAS